MSYQPQYSFWPYYQAAPQHFLGPAKSAGWLLFSLGVLLILIASCFGAVIFSLADAEFEKVIQQATQQTPELRQFSVTPRMMRTVYGIFIGLIGVYGLIILPIGLFVRRGTMLPIVLGLIFTILPLLLLGLMLLMSLASGVEGILAFVCVCGIPIALLVTATIFLIRAAGNVSKITQAQQQMQAMYQQQMSQYYGQQPPTT